MEIERLKAATTTTSESLDSIRPEKESMQTEEKVVEIDEDTTVKSDPTDGGEVIGNQDPPSLVAPTLDDNNKKPREMSEESLTCPFNRSDAFSKQIAEPPSEDAGFHLKSSNLSGEAASENTALGTIQILADALPKIVPYILINHREELLPLMMCAIEHHPDSTIRDSLTHTLFNLIKRPDEQQRRIIMDACVSLAKNVGEMRKETELLPQCWEQIYHMYEERRLLVAQSCGELAEFVRPEIRDSLILSIVQQLIDDSATVVREAAARNLALLLPLFPNVDKYFKRAPPLSGVEGSMESHLRVLGERERWNIDVLLRMLAELLPFVYQKAIQTCPFLLAVTELFGEAYLTHIMLSVFLIAVGDEADVTFLASSIHPRIKCLRPRTTMGERLATLCVLPLLLAGVLGAPSKHEELAAYLRKLLVEGTVQDNQATMHNAEIVNSIRSLCTFEEHHGLMFNILWEMVVSTNMDMKIITANLLKVIVSYIDAKVASTHVLPALVTLGSDQNLTVKYANLSADSVRDYLLPAIQNLLKDPDALDPAHKEALEIILKERSGGTFEAISKVMGAHLGLASSVSSFFGEGGLLGKKESADAPPPPLEPVESPKHVPPPPAEDTRFRRIMRGNFTDMLRGKTTKGEDETPQNQ
ncbi:LisH domain and HEAT repeat-containing protein [Tripterygium wilfordii]|uniref:LisH domain and HEAT repeat-containing protein n=1 Tax=Tripterygium wilfordii TaxID=458696 RepID=A0A7J7DUW9_TRIWF|nr:LisH domain and HEAT repeat-containing protein [Tripterygium wilfordii]